MIAFDLECSKGHVFEGWFNTLDSFEDQNRKNLVDCPFCGDTEIKKILSPVAVKSTKKPKVPGNLQNINYQRLAREVVHYINENFEDVGANFTKEALKIHYGVSEKKNIKGSATTEEEKTLKEEGVDFFKVPSLKKEDDS